MANPRTIKCVVSSINNHDENVSTVTLKPSLRIPNFLPGQFLRLAIDPYDPTGGFWPESHVFSIASLPSDPEITLTYVVKGKFTQRMKGVLYVDKEVWIKLPYGRFTLSASMNEEVTLVAGGTGITPFVSFILYELNHPSGISLKLVYGVRKPELLLFKDILMKAITNLKDFKFYSFSEHDTQHVLDFPVASGPLTFDSMWRIPQDPLNATFYLSGPIEMIRTFKNGLIVRGIDPDKIRIDEWE